jgi:cytokinin dehydrogenase
LPDTEVAGFIQSVCKSPEASAPIWSFEVSPKRRSAHRQALFMLPASGISHEVRIQRRLQSADSAQRLAFVSQTQALAAEVLDRGGKVYPPYSPLLNPEQWRQQFGRETWARFSRAKALYDPLKLLNPGAGIFAV